MDFKKKIYILLSVGIFFLSLSGILIKIADAPPLITAFYRMLFAVIILTPYFILKHRDKMSYFLDFRPALVGFLLALHFILWITSIEYTDVSNSVIFVALQPLFTVILEFLFAKDDLRQGVITGILLSIVGSIIISIGDLQTLQSKLFGDFLALSAAFFAASYLFIGRGVRKKLDYFPYLYILYTYAAFFLALGVLLMDIPFTGYGNINYLIFFALSIGPTLVGHSILNYSVRFLPTSVVSLSILGEPILTTFFAWILLGEKVMKTTMLGGTFILLGIYLAVSYDSWKNKKISYQKECENEY